MPLCREVGLSPSDIVLDGEPAPPPPKGAGAPPIFGQCLLWPNGWMDQDGTWYEGRPRPRPQCVTWGSSYSRKGHSSPHFSAHDNCGQTAGWIKIPLGTKVGLGPGDDVLDARPNGKGHSKPPSPLSRFRREHAFVNCGPCLWWRSCRPSQQLLNSSLLLIKFGSHHYRITRKSLTVLGGVLCD